ncbi:MAG: alpha/beta hydrolase [Dysgonamonadaceae bacterium]|jgi:acetyl esterase/lipase|nr:alpha/beta hydrolase [Dysgonamonadaceae bacterium]
MIIRIKYIILLVFCIYNFLLFGQETKTTIKEVYLYNKIKEQFKEEHTQDPTFGLLVRRVTNPSFTAFIPDNNNFKSAVIICPGGGYHTQLMDREGFNVAKEFNKLGIAAFVLKYRLPNDILTDEKPFAPLKDAQQTIYLIRKNAKQWGIDPDKIGIMGFSAGGHLAASLGVHYDSILIENNQKINLRPDFMILINPVISFSDSIGHSGSRDNLLGQSPNMEKVTFFSNELHVNKDSPKSFLIHTNDDSVVDVKNSLNFYEQLKVNNVPVELHIYSRGNHGFIQIPEFEEWFNRCVHWMKIEKII